MTHIRWLLILALITSSLVYGCIEIVTPAPAPSPVPDAESTPATPTAPAPDNESITIPGPGADEGPTPTSPSEPSPGPTIDPVFIPPLTEVPSPCPSGTSPSQIEHFTIPQTGWKWKPSVTISARADDPRIQLTKKAINFWNDQFSDIGTRFRLGPVTHITKLAPDEYMLAVTAGMDDDNPRPPLPDKIKNMPGDIVIALSDANFVSFSGRPNQQPCFIAIRSNDTPPMSLTNVILNVIAHELGHAVGLGHNNDPTALMCGRPAECRPECYHCDHAQIFRLTKKEKSFLRELYPTTWTSTK